MKNLSGDNTMINENFIDRVINILLEMRLDEGKVKRRNKRDRQYHDEEEGRQYNREQGNPSMNPDDNKRAARQDRRDTNFPSSWHGNQKGPLETRGVKR